MIAAGTVAVVDKLIIKTLTIFIAQTSQIKSLTVPLHSIIYTPVANKIINNREILIISQVFMNTILMWAMKTT